MVENRDGIRILIVDDDDEYRSVVSRRFQRRGYQVEQTGSPHEALRSAEKSRFDVAVLDIAMPEMDGVQLLERLRQVSPDTQVILLTGQGTIETAIRAMKLGAYDFLTKPCVLAELELQAEHRRARRGDWRGRIRPSGRCSAAPSPAKSSARPRRSRKCCG